MSNNLSALGRFYSDRKFQYEMCYKIKMLHYGWVWQVIHIMKDAL